MTCKHCGASISEYDIQCPYCDSYVDHGFEEWKNEPEDTPEMYSPLSRGRNYAPQYDKVNPVLLIFSFFPLIGTVLGAVLIASGYKKSGTVYLLTSLAVYIAPILFAIICAIIT